VPDLAPILEALDEAGWPLFMELEERWYQVSSGRTGVMQFLVQDPDGYLIRYSHALACNPNAGSAHGL